MQLELLQALHRAMPDYHVVECEPGRVRGDKELLVRMVTGDKHPWSYGDGYTAFRGSTFDMIGRTLPESVFDKKRYGIGLIEAGVADGVIDLPEPYVLKYTTDLNLEDILDTMGKYVTYSADGVLYAVMKEYPDIQSYGTAIGRWNAEECVLDVIDFQFDMLDTMHREFIQPEYELDADTLREYRRALLTYQGEWKSAFIKAFTDKAEKFAADIDSFDAEKDLRFARNFINPAYVRIKNDLENQIHIKETREKQLRDLRADLDLAEELVAKYERKLEDTTSRIDLTRQLEIIKAMPKVTSVKLNSGELAVQYKDLVMRVHGVKYNLPKLIEIHFHHTGEIYGTNLDTNSAVHPHMQGDSICAGNAGEVFPDLFSEVRYDDLVDYMQVFLETAQPSDAWGQNYALYNFTDIAGIPQGIGWDCHSAKLWNTLKEYGFIPAGLLCEEYKLLTVYGSNIGGLGIPVPHDFDNAYLVDFLRKLGYRKYELHGADIAVLKSGLRTYASTESDDLSIGANSIGWYRENYPSNNIYINISDTYMRYLLETNVDYEYLKEV